KNGETTPPRQPRIAGRPVVACNQWISLAAVQPCGDAILRRRLGSLKVLYRGATCQQRQNCGATICLKERAIRTPLAFGPHSVLILFVLREPVSHLGRLDAAMIDYVRQCRRSSPFVTQLEP